MGADCVFMVALLFDLLSTRAFPMIEEKAMRYRLSKRCTKSINIHNGDRTEHFLRGIVISVRASVFHERNTPRYFTE